jgi:uncharacterized protein DUF4411
VSRPIYVLDSGVFRVMQNYYPAQFKTFWADLERLVSGGRVVSVEEVSKEIDRVVQEQHVLDWRDQHKGLFTPPTEAEMAIVADIFKVPQFLGLVKKRNRTQGLPVADPWVIAKAKVLGGCVVTTEVRAQNGAKIPNVCDHFGVDVTNPTGMFEQEGWKY